MDKDYILKELDTAIEYLSPLKEMIFDKEGIIEMTKNIVTLKELLVSLRDKVATELCK